MFGVTPFNRSVVHRKNEPSTFNDLIDDFFGDDFFPLRSLRYDTFKVDIREEQNMYLIEADMPGIKKEEIHLDYQDGLLSISIEHEEKKEEENKNYVHRERKQTAMHRTLNLGELDIDKIEASLKDGILNIKAPKAEIVESKKRIQIK
jgi:HSP20 family protein